MDPSENIDAVKVYKTNPAMETLSPNWVINEIKVQTL